MSNWLEMSLAETGKKEKQKMVNLRAGQLNYFWHSCKYQEEREEKREEKNGKGQV